MWRKKQFECLLWTDRLCLNQDDEKEMAQQIPRMGLIYSQAESVRIWLGLSAWEEKYFQKHMEWVKKQLEGPRERFNSWSSPPPQHRLATRSVQDHGYWKRMWITQEVTMARKVVVEMQDTPSFDLKEMRDAMTNFRSIHDQIPWRIIDLIDARTSEGTPSFHPRPSWVLLRNHCQRQCTRRHDHIYGLLGMVKENDPILQITIDYSKPASDVLFDALFTATNPSLGEENFVVVDSLMSIGLLGDIESLEDYSNRDHSWKLTENEVVKTFARIALGVFDGLNLIAETCDGLTLSSSNIQKSLEKVKRLDPADVDEFQWKAIIGIILTSAPGESSQRTHEQWNGTREQWKRVRWPKFKTQSNALWLCSNHSPQPAQGQLWIGDRISLNCHRFQLNDIVKTCRNYRHHGTPCEGSKMSLEVPDSGTRLELDYTAHTEKGYKTHNRTEVYLTIWFQHRASGSM